MAQRKKKSVGPRSTRKRGTTTWTSLTWNDLDRWAGSRSVARGRTYQRQGRVSTLSITDDGKLLANVAGGELYVTSVWLTEGRRKDERIDSECTCPVGASGCKHAVAVVADYLAALAEQRPVPVVDAADQRWAELSQAKNDDFDDEDDPDEDEFESDDVDDESRFGRHAQGRSKAAQEGRAKRPSQAEWDEKIKAHVQQQSREELSGLVLSLIGRFPELRQEFQERIALGEGDVDKCVAMVRREMRAVTAEFGWQNHWNNEGHTPNFERLRHRLERLADLGHADRVVELGRELISRGLDQVGQSHDEGETAQGLADCLEVVFAALEKSSLAPSDKILYAVDASLQDDYGVVDSVAGKILGARWSAADWSLVADRLEKRLQKIPPGKTQDDFSRKYQRDRLSRQLLDALEQAGRRSELLSVYEAEARATGSYQRLVDYLITLKRYEDAQRWACEGIRQTQQKYPGIASGLAKSLCEVARRGKRWDIVASHAACNYLIHPSSTAFEELEAAAKKAKCLKPVRAAALRFLETGVPPVRVSLDTKKGHAAALDPDWPLPLPDYLLPLMCSRWPKSTPEPHYEVLLDMAIREKRQDDVLRWYDAMTSSKKHSPRRPHFMDCYHDSDRVAKAVASAHPQRALEIYRRKLDFQLRLTGTTAYESCAKSLRDMRPIYKALDQEDHWSELLADIRHNYRNRPRFMEILDKLQGKAIIESHKLPKRR